MHPEILRNGPEDCPKCGMALEPIIPGEADSESRLLFDRFLLALFLCIPVVGLEMAPMISIQMPSGSWQPWVECILSIPVVFWCGAPIWAKGASSLVNGSLNMFSLIILGTGISFFYSLTLLLFVGKIVPVSTSGDYYFEASTVIMTLVLMGQWLEAKGRTKAGSALRELLDLTPPTALLLTKDGEMDLEVRIEDLKRGDLVRILPGGKIPADGLVVQGNGFVDESMLTGESLSAEKSPGSKVSAGTMNATGSLVIRVNHAGGETVLSQIISLVAQAQRSQAPIQHLADRVASIFVPLVMIVSLFTFCIWMIIGPRPHLEHALSTAVAVIIIACPCALGLATPMALIVGVGKAARNGILVRSATALQNLASANLLAIDKTGTLTEGIPRLISIRSAGKLSEEALLALAAGAELGSEHPLARSLLHFAKERGVVFSKPSSFQSFPGAGVSAVVDGESVLVGTPEFLAGQNVPTSFLDSMKLQPGEGMTSLAVGGRLEGAFFFRDAVRSSAKRMVRELKSLGIRLVILTGDRRSTAEAVANELGITDCYSELSPAGKAAHITAWKTEGYRTAMAGDGINDAPALASADTSIAMGGGADIAKETAGIILLHPSLDGVVSSIRISRAILKIIRENLFFAFAYNIIGIPVAAGILYPLHGILLNPMISAAAMSLSSVSVIVNSLRLRGSRL